MARLDEPLTINAMRLRNRLALPPLTTNYGTADGQVTNDVLGFYRQRARDVGLLIVEATPVRADGRATPYNLGLWNDAQVPGMASLVEVIKAEGAAAVVQLGHAGARSVSIGAGIRGASPSGFAFRPDVEPTVLSEGQIGEIARDYAAAAARAAAAGFDGVEVHGAHFALISQFLSPLANRRDDRYGGDAAGRATFALEVVRATRDRLGGKYPMIFLLNAVEMVDGGQALEDAVVVARLVEAAGVDAVRVTMIGQTSWREVEGRRYLQPSITLPKEMPRGIGAVYAAEIKRALGVPVIAEGKLGDAVEAARVLEEGMADMVAIGRQMIADPGTAGKILCGRGSEIIPCKEDLACMASIGRGKPLKCSVNLNPAGPPRYARAG